MADPIDPEKLGEYLTSVFDTLRGAVTAAMIHLGDRLGLYAALAEAGPLDSGGLAERTGLQERWVREWLYQQGAVGLLERVGDGRFALSPEGEVVLVNERHPAFGAGFFSHLPQTLAVTDRVAESFRSGIGLPYDAFGPGGAQGVERGFAPWFRTQLVPVALPRLEGVVEQLEAGALAADIGCGGGVALLEMARAFPKSEFHGYEISSYALERAEENRSEAGLDNVVLHDARTDPLPDAPRYGLMTTFDCLHDMTDPQGVMRGIRGAIRPDGTWLICDIKAHETYEENVERNPMSGLMYGISVLTCMSSALSEPGGAGLGTLGLPEALARRMTLEAGFTRFEPLDLGHPMNMFYIARP